MSSFESGTGAAFAVVDASTDRLLGSVSLLWIDWKRSVSQAAYWLRREERGRGIATRAVRLIANWALIDLNLNRVELTMDVRNAASQRVAERAGFRPDGQRRASREIHGEHIDELVFSLTR